MAVGGVPVGDISAAIGVGQAFTQFTTSTLGFTWTNGTPDSSVTNTLTGLTNGGQGNGEGFTVPAGTTAHTIQVYVSVYNGTGQMYATLSDGSAPNYTDTSEVGGSGGAYACYTFTYAANSANQTLTVKWTNSTFGTVQMYAVAME